MSDSSILSIADMPEYKELLRKRYIVAVPLALVVFVAYIAFILMVAYTPQILSIVMPDGVSTFGIWYGLGLIILTLVVTAAYVVYSNTELDNLVKIIQEKRGQ